MSDTPNEVARRLADAFEAAGIPYAVGGALASNQYGVPRGTKDVDLNLFVDASAVDRVSAVLQAQALSFEAQALRQAATDGANVSLYSLVEGNQVGFDHAN